MVPGRFVYHAATPRLIGARLVPLFALEALDPAVFRDAMAKYEGREAAPFVAIPRLGIRFNDTVHCAPIHPWYIREAREAEGVIPGLGAIERRFYRIPVASILVNPVIWYRAQTVWINGAPGDGDAVAAEPPPDEFEVFDPDRYTELTKVPAAYRVRLRESLAANKHPLMFVKIPHVLVAGPIDLAEAEIIDGSSRPDWERTRA